MSSSNNTAVDPPGITATGIGSWPGTDVREALRVIRGELAETPDGVTGLPYLPELPARGPGADMIGRTAHLLVDLPVDLQPQGWRMVDRPGRDAERTGSLWRQDLDELAEAFDGWAGRFKVQVTGPWTLASALWLPLGDRVLSDPGAVRDLTESLAEGLRAHLSQVRGLLPDAQIVVQIDEPSLPTVLAGRVRTESKLSVIPAVESGPAQAALRSVLDAARAVGAATTVVHSCASSVPVEVLGSAGADIVALDLSLLDHPTWDQVAGFVEGGGELWAGVLPTDRILAPGRALEPLLEHWSRLGLGNERLGQVGISPTCGLAGASPAAAREITVATVTAARGLAEQHRG